jgi:LuxR family maltose regulon positive regulatory protein
VPDLLLTTKLHIPPVHGNLISRPRLVQRLNDSLDQNCRLSLISAPAGYGKSTLLSEWAAQLDYPIAWLSLENSDNDPLRFWSYFLSALTSLSELQQSGIGEAFQQALQSPQPPEMAALIDSLLNDLSQLTSNAVLVLDDLHFIKDGKIHNDLAYLVDHLPRADYSLHLLVASRMDPPWPLARWRVRGELTELRSSDLRFSPDEVSQFLHRTLQYEFSAQEINALQVRTEGWIAGLQMAALSIQGRMNSQGAESVSRFIETLSGTHRYILDYLMEEVINQQPVQIRDFLLSTSLLEQFTSPLCDAITESQDSQAILGQIEKANLFLIPLDDERHWYRYHHLFTDLLRKRLMQFEPDRIPLLHRRASQWYAQNHYLADAISHALDAGDVALVNQYISGNALAMVEQAELAGVLRHFEGMPEEQICSKPWLCVAYAWVKAYVDPSGEIDQVMVKAMQSANGVEDTLEKQHLNSHLDAIWAYIAWVKGKSDLALEFVHTALVNLPENDWLTRTHMLNIEGLSLQNLDHVPEAIQSFEAAVVAAQRTGKPSESYFAYTNWAYSEIIRGRLPKAYELCQHVLHLADQEEHMAKPLPVLAYAYATISIVECEWNQSDAAVAAARQALALAEQWRQADTLHFALTCLSEALCAAGDLESAFTANQRALRLGASTSPWFYQISISNEVLLHLARGDLAAAAQRFTEAEAIFDKENVSGLFLIVKVSLLHAQGRYSELLKSLVETLASIERKGKVWNLIRLLPFQALALQAMGRETEALTVLNHCLELAEPGGYLYSFVEKGAAMRRLLELAAGRSIQKEYIERLLPAFHTGEALARSTPPQDLLKSQSITLLEPLSERELQVLRMLDSPLTSDEIGRELYISTNTVRTHIKNIYAKLGVNRRLEAVQKAKEIKLM